MHPLDMLQPHKAWLIIGALFASNLNENLNLPSDHHQFPLSVLHPLTYAGPMSVLPHFIKPNKVCVPTFWSQKCESVHHSGADSWDDWLWWSCWWICTEGQVYCGMPVVILKCWNTFVLGSLLDLVRLVRCLSADGSLENLVNEWC